MSVYDSAVLADSPIAFYPMNETSGSTIFDISGNAHDATITGSLTLGVTGIGDGETAISGFDNGSNFITLPNGLTIPANHAITVEYWMDLASTAQNAYCAFQLGTSPNYGTTFNPFTTDGNIYWDYGGNTGSSRVHAVMPGIGSWQQVVLVADTNFQAIYINGSLLVSASAWSPPVSPVVGGTLGFGVVVNRGQVSCPTAKFAVYDHALSAARVGAHYAAANPTLFPPAITPPTIATITPYAGNAAPAAYTANAAVSPYSSTSSIAAYMSTFAVQYTSSPAIVAYTSTASAVNYTSTATLPSTFPP